MTHESKVDKAVEIAAHIVGTGVEPGQVDVESVLDLVDVIDTRVAEREAEPAEPTPEPDPVPAEPEPEPEPPAEPTWDVQHAGVFRLEKTGDSNSADTFLNGGGAAGIDVPAQAMYIGAHIERGMVGLVRIPEPVVSDKDWSIINTAEFVDPAEPFFDPIGDLRISQNPDFPKWWRYGGFLVHEGVVLFTLFYYYNVTGANWLSQGAFGHDALWAPGPLDSDDGVSQGGPWHLNKHAGYMFEWPEDFAHEHLDGCRIGFGQTAIANQAMTSLGPSAYAVHIDPANLPAQGDELAGIPLKYHPMPLSTVGVREDYQELDHTLADQWKGGCVLTWPDGSRAFAAIGRKGLGPEWYGAGADYPHYQPTATNWKGYHADPYTAQLRLYRLEDIAASANATRNPWEIAPFKTIALDDHLWGKPTKWVGSLMFDPTRFRAYFIERQVRVEGTYADLPLVHALDLV